ncbi:MAG TPA: arginine deiminase family protein [Myxococcota bacterium]|nr:arginine deiminase family protein [Myxococcota bacterium]
MPTDKTPAAYGGRGFAPREHSLREEIGSIWSACGQHCEYSPLAAVLMHRPGGELARSVNPDAVLMLEQLDPDLAARQHTALAETYRRAGVNVYSVVPDGFSRSRPPPNLMFVADLFFMTPEGAILARPASLVRAGEERHIAWRLADLGVPILMSVHGKGTFEGADAAWLDEKSVLLARGRRTNHEGAEQVAAILTGIGVTTILVDLPEDGMHLMGQLRFLDKRTVVSWPGRNSSQTLRTLGEHGYSVLEMPDTEELRHGMALNFVCLSPRRVVMPAGNPASQAFLEKRGVECLPVEVEEITKAAGAIGCLTGVLQRR